MVKATVADRAAAFLVVGRVVVEESLPGKVLVLVVVVVVM
jgi:hypothetical protein